MNVGESDWQDKYISLHISPRDLMKLVSSKQSLGEMCKLARPPIFTFIWKRLITKLLACYDNRRGESLRMSRVVYPRPGPLQLSSSGRLKFKSFYSPRPGPPSTINFQLRRESLPSSGRLAPGKKGRASSSRTTTSEALN